MIKKSALILGTLLALQFGLLLVSRFTAWPEMLAWPYFILKGLLPYKDIAIAHTPLMIIDLALHFKILGASVLSLKIFTWIFIFLIDLLLYSSVSKIWDKKKALLALAAYIPLQVFYGGNGLWFDLYMSLFAFWSFAFARKNKFAWAGVMWALAFLSKQTAFWFLIPLAFEIINKPKDRLKKFISGAFVVGVIFVLGLLSFGIGNDFLNWAINFGILILPKSQGQISLPTLKQLAFALFPLLALVPVVIKNNKERNLFLWVLAGALGVYPRWELFHFQPALPFIAVGWGLFLSSFRNYSKLFKLTLLVYILLCVFIVGKTLYREKGLETRFYEKEVQSVSSYVSSIADKDEKLFVLNYWDSVYPLTSTLPATNPWVPQLEWYMEQPNIQEKMVLDLAQEPPQFIVAKPYSELGLSAYKPEKIISYINEHYELFNTVEGVNILKLKGSK